jgi:hypothetical protein
MVCEANAHFSGASCPANNDDKKVALRTRHLPRCRGSILVTKQVVHLPSFGRQRQTRQRGYRLPWPISLVHHD